MAASAECFIFFRNIATKPGSEKPSWQKWLFNSQLELFISLTAVFAINLASREISLKIGKTRKEKGEEEKEKIGTQAFWKDPVRNFHIYTPTYIIHPQSLGSGNYYRKNCLLYIQ